MKKLNKKKYKKDFPDIGNFNWVYARITKGINNGVKLASVLLHDGTLAMYGMHYEKGEFEIIKYNLLDDYM